MFICFLIFASIGHFALDRETPANTPKAGVAMICFAAFFIFGFATTWVSVPERYWCSQTVLTIAGPHDMDYLW